MINPRLHQRDIIKQDAKVGIMIKKGFSLTRLIHNLIREHGKHHLGSYTIDTADFTTTDKKLLISHLEAASEYEYACSSPTRLNAAFAEHSKYIDELLNDEAFEVYQEDMEEMRSYR